MGAELTEKIIQVRQLEKSYGKERAVDGVSFHVQKGAMLALLGPNGAGKSTILNILCTCIAPDGGEVIMDGFVLGRHDRKIRSRIGIVFQDGVLDDALTIEENLHIRGNFYGLRGNEISERIENIADMTSIRRILDKCYGHLSGGQRRRCDIARALIHEPRILFLDEPAAGLDPDMRNGIWETIQTIRSRTNMTVFLTTHDMEEAARADQIIVMRKGVILAEGTPDMMKATYARARLTLFSGWPDSLAAALERNGIPYRKQQEGVDVFLENTLDAISVLELCRGKYTGFEVKQGSMDNAYLAIVGGNSGICENGGFCGIREKGR